MRNRNNDNEISLRAIIACLVFVPPVGVFLGFIKYVLPHVKDIFGTFFGGRTNRYSGYEKNGRDVFEDIWNSPDAKHNRTSSSTSKNTEKSSGDNDSTRAKNTNNNYVKIRDPKIPYKVRSVVLLAIGGIFLFAMLMTIPGNIMHFGMDYIRSAEFVADIVMTVFLVIAPIFLGIRYRKKIKLAKKYASVVGTRPAVKLSEIAAALSISKSKAQKELQAVIECGVFGKHAHIDIGTGYFLRDASFKPAEEPKENTQDTVNEEMDKYASILAEIRRLDDEILDEPVSNKIVTIENYTKKIFDYLKKNPGQEKNVHSFMTYYLPTTLKLLKSYSEIERVGVAGENMKSAKENIEKTLDLLSEAFKLLLDKLYESDNIDISTDIDVLEQMMKKDGLSGNGFNI